MKISELIQKLTEAQNAHGDLEIVIQSPDNGSYYGGEKNDLSRVSIEGEGKCKILILG